MSGTEHAVSQVVCQVPAGRRVFMVEYPGFVRDDRRALRTMGGEETIAQRHLRGAAADCAAQGAGEEGERGGKKRGKKREREEEEVGDGAENEGSKGSREGKDEECGGGKVEGTGSEDKKEGVEEEEAEEEEKEEKGGKGEEEGGEEEEDEEEQEVDISVVARIEETYRFDSLPDFQWVPLLHASPTRHQVSSSLPLCSAIPPPSPCPPPHPLPPPPFPHSLSPGGLSVGGITARPAHGTTPQTSHKVPHAVHPPCFPLRSPPVSSLFFPSRALLRFAYYFCNGPFRMQWIRNGYDPRTNPDNRKYQMLDFRVPASWGLRITPAMARTTTWPDICALRSLPNRRTLFLTLCDLSLPLVQETLAAPPERQTCDPTSGFFHKQTLARMRDAVRLAFYRLLPNRHELSLFYPRVRNTRGYSVRKPVKLAPGELSLPEADAYLTGEKKGSVWRKPEIGGESSGREEGGGEREGEEEKEEGRGAGEGSGEGEDAGDSGRHGGVGWGPPGGDSVGRKTFGEGDVERGTERENRGDGEGGSEGVAEVGRDGDMDGWMEREEEMQGEDTEGGPLLAMYGGDVGEEDRGEEVRGEEGEEGREDGREEDREEDGEEGRGGDERGDSLMDDREGGGAIAGEDVWAMCEEEGEDGEGGGRDGGEGEEGEERGEEEEEEDEMVMGEEEGGGEYSRGQAEETMQTEERVVHIWVGSRAAGMGQQHDYQYKHFKATVPERQISVGVGNQLRWRYYDFGPKAIPPLLCLGGVAATADAFHKQVLALAAKGFRVIAADPPPVWSHQQWIKAVDQFLDALRVHQVHLYGTSLGGFLFQLYAQQRPRRVLSLVLSNSFFDTHFFNVAFGSWSSMFPYAPDFVLKRLVLSGLRDGPHEPLIADSIDFVVSRLDSLSRSELASRLTLNTLPAVLPPLQQMPEQNMTLMDCNDFAAVAWQLRDALYTRYPNATRAFLKSGGDFPFLSRADEVNLHLFLHLRRVDAEREPGHTDILAPTVPVVPAWAQDWEGAA
ncbi:unnamed protein product [Closterium sp. Yama58-4]|nr:unnamed protein product [Closterium sp. Yama58-4]